MLDPIDLPVASLVDSEGRPLKEFHAPPLVKRGVEMERIECPYHGVRQKHSNPMNISALRQITEHWDRLAEDIRFICSLVRPAGGKLRPFELWKIGKLGESLPQFLVYRASHSVPNGEILPSVGGLYKIFIGYNVGTLWLIKTFLQKNPERLEDQVSIDELINFYEEERLVIGPQEVCAGPGPMIRRILKMLETPTEESHLIGNAYLLTRDVEAFKKFSWAMANAATLSMVFTLIAESLYAKIFNEVLQDQSPSTLPLVPANPKYKWFGDTDDDTIRASFRKLTETIIIYEHSNEELLRRSLEGLLDSFCGDQVFKPDDSFDLKEQKHTKARLTPVVRKAILSYLRTERACAQIAMLLKHQYLSALGLESSRHMMALSTEFVPPIAKMRMLLSIVFNIDCAGMLRDGRDDPFRVAGIIDKEF